MDRKVSSHILQPGRSKQHFVKLPTQHQWVGPQLSLWSSLANTKYILSIYFSDLPKGPFTKRSFGQKVLLEKVLWCKGPFDQRSFDFGGPLAKGPLEKLLCDKVLMLKVSLPQPIFDVWYNIAKKFQKSPFWGFCYIPYPYTRPPLIFLN